MHRFFMLIVAGLILAPAAWAAAPNASFTTNRPGCMAPCAIYVDARASSDPDLVAPAGSFMDINVLELQFQWNFGDDPSAVWNMGARAGTGSPHPKNKDTGPWSGHVYENPGTYTITLQVCDEPNSCDTATRTVTVTPPSSHIPSGDTWCFSNDSDFGGCPPGARQQVTSDFDAALNSQCDVQSGPRQCLFKRGDQFTSSATVSFDNAGPGLIGAFGSSSDPDPVVNWSNAAAFQTGNAPVQDWRIMDLDFHGNHGSSFYRVAGNTTRQLTILRVDITDGDDSLDFYGGNAFTPGVNMHREIAIVDSSSLSAGGPGGTTIDLFFSIEQSFVMGNHFGLQDSPQHVSRWNWLDGVAISHNSMGGGNHTVNVMKIHNIKNNDNSGRYCTTDFILADNLFESALHNGKDVMIGINGRRAYECVENFIVERNLFRVDQNLDQYTKWILTLRGGPAIVRNNVFDMSDVEEVGGLRGIQIYEEVPGQTRTPDHSRIYNNTFYSSENTQGSHGINIEGSVSNLVVKNNIGYFPQPNIQLMRDNGQNTQKCSGCNVSLTGGTSPFRVNNPREIFDFALAQGSTELGKGEPVAAASFDLLGNPIDMSRETDRGAFYIQGGADIPTGGGGNTGGGSTGGGGTPGPPAPPVLLP